jgi:hypothetical protein
MVVVMVVVMVMVMDMSGLSSQHAAVWECALRGRSLS